MTHARDFVGNSLRQLRYINYVYSYHGLLGQLCQLYTTIWDFDVTHAKRFVIAICLGNKSSQINIFMLDMHVSYVAVASQSISKLNTQGLQHRGVSLARFCIVAFIPELILARILVILYIIQAIPAYQIRQIQNNSSYSNTSEVTIIAMHGHVHDS